MSTVNGQVSWVSVIKSWRTNFAIDYQYIRVVRSFCCCLFWDHTQWYFENYSLVPPGSTWGTLQCQGLNLEIQFLGHMFELFELFHYPLENIFKAIISFLLTSQINEKNQIRKSDKWQLASVGCIINQLILGISQVVLNPVMGSSSWWCFELWGQPGYQGAWFKKHSLAT